MTNYVCVCFNQVCHFTSRIQGMLEVRLELPADKNTITLHYQETANMFLDKIWALGEGGKNVG